MRREFVEVPSYRVRRIDAPWHRGCDAGSYGVPILTIIELGRCIRYTQTERQDEEATVKLSDDPQLSTQLGVNPWPSRCWKRCVTTTWRS